MNLGCGDGCTAINNKIHWIKKTYELNVPPKTSAPLEVCFSVGSARIFTLKKLLGKAGKRGWGGSPGHKIPFFFFFFKQKPIKSEKVSSWGSMYKSDLRGSEQATILMIHRSQRSRQRGCGSSCCSRLGGCAMRATSSSEGMARPGHTARASWTLSLSKSTGTHTKHGLKDFGRSKNFSFKRC